MSVKGHIKEGAGYLEEETGEMMKKSNMANKGRKLRNEGRMEDGKAPKLTPPGSGNKA